MIAAGFEGGPAQTLWGGLSAFLAADPQFLENHFEAAKIVRSERGGRVPTLDELEKDCRRIEAQGWREDQFRARHHDPPREVGFLRAGTNPPARIAIDGKDSGQTTPIDVDDRVFVGYGKHRITFVGVTKSVEIEVDVPERQNTCFYRELSE